MSKQISELNAKELISYMLTQNTGESFLDSGGAYGRHWQRNQGKDFDAQPMVEVDNDGTFTVNLYPYLKENLRLDGICDDLNGIMERMDDRPTIQEAMSLFSEFYPYFDLTEIGTNNTYNIEASFSQDFMYCIFKNDGTGKFYIALSIHQGCDIRGGYTDIKFFEIDNYIPLTTVYSDYEGTIFSSECDGMTLRDGANNSIEDFDNIDPENLENVWAISSELDGIF